MFLFVLDFEFFFLDLLLLPSLQVLLFIVFFFNWCCFWNLKFQSTFNSFPEFSLFIIISIYFKIWLETFQFDFYKFRLDCFQLFQNTFVIFFLQSEKQTCALYSHVLIIGFRVIDYVDMAQTRGVLWNTNHEQNCGHQSCLTCSYFSTICLCCNAK